MQACPEALLDEDGAPEGRVLASFYVDTARDAGGRAVRTQVRVPFRFIAAD